MGTILRSFVVGVVLLAGCSPGTQHPSATVPPMPEAPDWSSASYRFTLESRCGERALIGRYAVAVQHGTVTSARALGSTSMDDAPGDPAVEDVPSIGELVVRAQTTDRDALTDFHLDPATGIPTAIAFDPDPRALDDEECYAISDYAALE